MPETATLNHKRLCYINTIRESLFYYTMKNDGRRPNVIFMSEPLWILLGGTNKTKSCFDDYKILVFYSEDYSYYFADEHQKGREP